MPTQVQMVFDNQYHGILTGHHGSASIGPNEGSLTPYDMVLGGLGACLNHTFQVVLDKKRLTFQSVKYDMIGIKRQEVPTTLKEVTVNVILTGVEESNQHHFLRAMDIATNHCSVYQTLSHVAKMTTVVTFK